MYSGLIGGSLAGNFPITFKGGNADGIIANPPGSTVNLKSGNKINSTTDVKGNAAQPKLLKK